VVLEEIPVAIQYLVRLLLLEGATVVVALVRKMELMVGLGVVVEL
jgi:hypothetical protein